MANSHSRKNIDSSQCLSGRRFDRYLVTGDSPVIVKSKRKWECRCDCGRVRIVLAYDLLRGASNSCGCKSREIASIRMKKINTTHGMTFTSEFNTWCNVIQRCNNPNDTAYRRYGGRGIRVCDRWSGSFENFYADMGPKPSPEHSIDRINNDGNYDPENCRWATRKEQLSNKGNNRMIEFDGRKQTITEWGREFGLSMELISYRLGRGWSICRALTTSPRQSRRIK